MHVSGREVRSARTAAPLWRIELNYDLLRMASPYAEFQAIAGFFAQCAGEGTAFYFEPPSLSPAIDQVLAVGDGITAIFPLVVSFGDYLFAPAGVGTLSALCLDGVPQTAGYTASTAPFAPSVTFATPPAAGVVVTASFDWLFLCRFEDDDLGLEEFMAQLYALQSLQLRTVRA